MNKSENIKPVKILFVCLGNICRSPAAEGIMRQIVAEGGDSSRYEIDSAGLYAGHAGELPDARMRAHAARRDLHLTHRSRPVRESDFRDFDLIVGMDDSNYDALRQMAPDLETEAKVCRMIDWVTQHPGHYSVPDPYYGGSEGFENVLDLLEDGCYNLYRSTREGNMTPPRQ